MGRRALLIIVSILVIPLVMIPVAGSEEYSFVDEKAMLGMMRRKEKLSHFRFYWHDILSGRNPTAVQIIPPLDNSSTKFGFTYMIDNPLTVAPQLSSRLVGRAQGFYASASQHEFGLLMIMNFAFIEGKYNGSTITVMGRNLIFEKVREMPVIGGSGLFRFARGFAQIKTHTFNQTTKDANVEYNVYVLHY